MEEVKAQTCTTQLAVNSSIIAQNDDKLLKKTFKNLSKVTVHSQSNNFLKKTLHWRVRP